MMYKILFIFYLFGKAMSLHTLEKKLPLSSAFDILFYQCDKYMYWPFYKSIFSFLFDC
jgi:hypothetical protein